MTTRLLGVLAVVAVLVAGWSGSSWWRAAHDDFATRARDRDAVLASASDALVALNTIDYRDARPSVDRWIQVTTGPLGRNLSGDRQLHLDRATASRTEASATLNQAVVTELHGDTARVIAVLDVRSSTNGAAPSSSRTRLKAELTRTAEAGRSTTYRRPHELVSPRLPSGHRAVGADGDHCAGGRVRRVGMAGGTRPAHR
ncbi:MAG TPA: hypothetical protein VJT49_26780 [Amycolatopsis sp.]|uniref:hypothetical protein n=1 Tax=Amycolatopsis sp. TaxID=37632 RepID=UPI002B499968|nr:hypothetical protein [Amycolatopsis sp.]HKS48650.1 hypothetical protein [Amycolatopsis sp.]